MHFAWAWTTLLRFGLEDDPALQAYREFQDTFGNDEVVAVGLARASGHQWLNIEGIQQLQEVDSIIEGVDGIEGADGILDTPTITGEGSEFRGGARFRCKRLDRSRRC